jgi:hypothetical protein
MNLIGLRIIFSSLPDAESTIPRRTHLSGHDAPVLGRSARSHTDRAAVPDLRYVESSRRLLVVFLVVDLGEFGIDNILAA